MPKPREGTAPIRQFRVTITESLDEGGGYALLSWRVFPCVADHWDGVMQVNVEVPDGLPITSQEALRRVLGALAEKPWPEPRRVTRSRR